MSALKLSATASTYVRAATATATATATTTKPKPKTFFLWKPIHHLHGRRITITPLSCAHMSPPKQHHNIPSPFTIPLHQRKPFSLSSQNSGTQLVSDMGSETKKEPHNNPSHSKFLTLPTILTLARVAAVPLLVATFYMDGYRGTVATTSIFIVAAVTDWLDGYLARKMKLKSSFGAFLDPVADKLMVAATLVLLCSRPLDVAVFGQAPWILTAPAIAIIGREITMSAVREWAASQDTKLLEAVAVNNLGKWKTATQMTALTILLATRHWSHGGAAIVVGSGVALLYTSAGLAVWSLVVYMRKIWKVLMR